MGMSLGICARLFECAAPRSKIASQTKRQWLNAARLTAAIAGAGVACGSSWQATAATYAWEEGYKQAIPSSNIEGLSGEGLFGEQIGLYTGSLSFAATDVELQGNNSLQVAFTRSYSLDDPKIRRSWKIDLPHLEGVYPKGKGWLRSLGGTSVGRCSAGSAAPPMAVGGVAGAMSGTSTWDATEYWNGDFIGIPGQGNEEILKATSTGARLPLDGKAYPWLTRSGWRMSCLPTAKNASGEAFLAVAPDGTRYYFDWFVTGQEEHLERPIAAGPAPKKPDGNHDSQTPTISANKVEYLMRERVLIYPSRVEDRFGNYVTYTYGPHGLTSISASDGRAITVVHNAGGGFSSVTAAGRTWTYGADASGQYRVTLPDGSYWQYGFANLSSQLKNPSDGGMLGSPQQQCDSPPQPIHGDPAPYVGTVKHPSGAIGTFTVAPTRHGRSYVDRACIGTQIAPGQYFAYAYRPYVFDVVSLTSRQISGPGLTTRTWRYEYGPPNNSWSQNCAGDICPGTKQVDVIAPDGVRTRHVFSNRFRLLEGKELSTEVFDAAGISRRKTSFSFRSDPAGQPYPAQIGMEGYLRGDQAATKFDPGAGASTRQDGVTFSSSVTAYDPFARPVVTTKSSSLGYSKTETTEYHDDLSIWVVGQVKRSSTNGTETSRTVYDTNTALPMSSYLFGKLKQSFVYNADGTLASVSNGRDSPTYDTTIRLAGWKRGIPQAISYPDGTSKSAQVNDRGWLDWIKDENGYKTCYGFDAMGRLASITHQSETQAGVCDTSAWSATTQTFLPVAVAEYGIPAGHWKHTASTGNARKVTYFDALWRPLLMREYDAGNVAVTDRYIATSYDLAGHQDFTSYAMSLAPSMVLGSWTDSSEAVALGLMAHGTRISTANDPMACSPPSDCEDPDPDPPPPPPPSGPALAGVHTSFDSLGRVETVRQDSELGVLQVTTEYLPGFKTKVTNPRRLATTTSYMAYDQPSTDWPTAVVHPEGAYTDILRDAFGKPQSVKRRNANSTIALTRNYTYFNDSQELCRTIEPETGATLMGYDLAGNLAWSASGLPSATGCDKEGDTATILARKAIRSYDRSNRVESLSFPDGLGDTTYTYTPDGLLETISAHNAGTSIVATTYGYNKRRLPTSERMQWGSIDWSIGYSYNANGHPASQTYPDNHAVSFMPNALGQPTRAGAYATGVSYFPNGAIKQFTYGNGIVHTLSQNVRQLPDTSRDAYGTTEVLDDGYDYDENANVAAISDGLAGARGNRTMTYDGLDRLSSTTSPMYGTTGASYTYDVLDNLKTVKAPGRDYTYVYDTAWRLTNVTNTVGGASVIGLGYDAQGNLANKNGVLYTFDHGNRLRSASGGLGTYVYDGHGRRVQDFTNASKYSLYSQAGQLVFASDSRKAEWTNYVYLGGSLVATRDRAHSGGAVTVAYQHTDSLGSPVAVTDASRVVLGRTEYEPYGKVINGAPNDGPGYTGHVLDAATGLNYMQQRYYDPDIGRFLSVDPVTADGNTGGNFNRYWYANNNPYRFMDPDGRQSKSQACGDVVYCGPDLKYRNLPNGEPPAGPFEPSKTKGEVAQNGKVQRNDAVKTNISTLRAAMDIKGHKATPLIVTGGESHVANDGKVRSVTDGSHIPNRLSNSAHNVENGSRAIDLRAISMPHAEFMSIVIGFTDFTNNTNDYGDKHEHLGLPNRPGFSCSSSICTEP